MVVEEKKEQEKPITFILLDESVTTRGVRVLMDGIDTSQFERNPVMFFLHEDSVLPIGRWDNLRKEAGHLLADAVFDYEDADPEVKRIIGKIERGFVRMASVDLRDLEFSDDPIYKLQGQEMPTVVKSRLRECSIVPIGGCHNAFRLFDSEGLEIDLSDSLKLSDLANLYKQENNMNKELLTELKLSDDASQSQIADAVRLVLSDNQTLRNDNELLLADNKSLQSELDAIKLQESEQHKNEFVKELDTAFKDGRLDNDSSGKIKTGWMKLYDVAPEATMENLSVLPKRQAVSQQLSDKTEKKDAWAERQREIEEANKGK